ncbi:glycosyltransferase [Corynebacterium epidermidicanis]|uniref:Glycosyltransferase n=1 Tax=Corynebacterium epidermidicanis TaxID=1050174 RepID=A0A0G3GR82_9CORY|nr:glycosyltransferase [Corynebacterium epidermidicanis]AKK03681.1 glycosyltransferase [Corynebacterium epidermidicanis]
MQNKLFVAQYVDNYGPGSNGLMVAVQQLEGNLLDAGHEVLVVAPQAKGMNPHEGRAGRTEIRLPSIRVPKMPTRVANGNKFKRTINQVAALQPDVIHAHGLGPVGVLGVWTALRTNTPLLLTWHTDFDAYADYYARVLPLLRGIVSMFARLNRGEVYDVRAIRAARLEFPDPEKASLLGLMRKMLLSANVVTAPSPKTLARALQIAPEANVVCVPNGVDPLPAGPPPVERGPGPLFLYVGRVAPEKGLNLLVDAFELVRELHPDAQLMIVGDWERYPKIAKRLLAAQRGGNVLLPGEFPRNELGAFYAMADCFVFPSVTDTQALVLHEAALAGLPIVSADPELNLVLEPRQNGELAGPAPTAFAAAMLRIIDRLEEPGWRESAAQRSRELAGQWSVASQAAEMLRIYELTAQRKYEAVVRKHEDFGANRRAE